MEEVAKKDKSLSFWKRWQIKRQEKLKQRYFSETDIRYRGPLSYRAMRIIGWIFFAVGQLTMIGTIFFKVLHIELYNEAEDYIISFIRLAATTLFLVANFGLVFNNKRSYKNALLTYGGFYLGIALFITLLYYHYIQSLMGRTGISEDVKNIVDSFMSGKAEINIFADLLAAASFHFFINYTPTKHFRGKKVKYFRLFALIPVIYVLTCYTLKVCANEQLITIPFGVYLYMTTKSPFIHLIFALITLWLKYREKVFIKLGGTKKSYQEYLLTNRNSWSFSLHIATLFAFFAIIDWVIVIISISFEDEAYYQFVDTAIAFGAGECAGLIFAIPFILLFSYTRTHKNKTIDVIVPIAGVVTFVLVYLEGFYRLIIRLVG